MEGPGRERERRGWGKEGGGRGKRAVGEGDVTEGKYLLTTASSPPISNLTKTPQQEPNAQSCVSNLPPPAFVQNLSSSSIVRDSALTSTTRHNSC